ncbi:hypothetical protein ACIOBK_34260 [Micromonospora chokoriensis]
MLVAPHGDSSVYWLPDRHATFDNLLRPTTVHVVGTISRMLEARPNDYGVITFAEVTEHRAHVAPPYSPPGRAFLALTDPENVRQVTFPPYVGNICPQPDGWRSPDALMWLHEVAIYRARGLLCWLAHMPCEDPELITARILPSGAIDWSNGRVPRLEEWPATDRAALDEIESELLAADRFASSSCAD